MPAHESVEIPVEPMRRPDLPEVVAIEALSFSLPWTPEMFEADLAREELAIMLVARAPLHPTPSPVAGYLCAYTLTDELHINNLAVHPLWRRNGVAHALLAAALAAGRERGARRAFLEVRISNVAAQALYRAFGFQTAGIRRHYYSQPREDALVMERRGL